MGEGHGCNDLASYGGALLAAHAWSVCLACLLTCLVAQVDDAAPLFLDADVDLAALAAQVGVEEDDEEEEIVVSMGMEVRQVAGW